MTTSNVPAGVADGSIGRMFAMTFLFTVAGVGTLLTIVSGWATLTFADGPDTATVMFLIGLISVSATGWFSGYVLVKHSIGTPRTVAAAMLLLNGVIIVVYAVVSMVDAARTDWNEMEALVRAGNLIFAAIGVAFLAVAWYLRPTHAAPTET